MDSYEKAFLDFILPMVNENRLQLLEKILLDRTQYLTVVLEDIYQSHNASAVLRTCDCLGIQDVHIIENRNEYDLNPDVELGAAQWLSLYKYGGETNNTKAALIELKKNGYRLVATTPHRDAVSPHEFNLSNGKAAILMGTELNGLSSVALEMADEFLKIPMHGFTESLNISVSAAIILHELSVRLRKSDIDWRLGAKEKEDIYYQWVKNSVNKVHAIEKGFKNNYSD